MPERLTIEFFVPGPPATAGSKTAFRTKSGKMNVTHSCKRFRSWSLEVKAAAQKAYSGPLLLGPLSLIVDVRLMRPKSHFRTGRNAHLLRDSSPWFHVQKPDLCKVIRAVEDSLTGVLWRDDSQVCTYGTCRKHWTVEHAGTRVVVIPQREPERR